MIIKIEKPEPAQIAAFFLRRWKGLCGRCRLSRRESSTEGGFLGSNATEEEESIILDYDWRRKRNVDKQRLFSSMLGFKEEEQSKFDLMDTNLTPRLGLEFENLEEAWQYWVSYGGKTGFGVRKQYFSKSRKDGAITSYRYVCCKEGVRRPDKRDYKTIHPRPETRTGCKARMTVSRMNGKYRIVDFVDEHNHPLHFPETVHLKPSQRKENEDDKDVKIRELTAELLRERKRRAVLQQQLEIILRGVEEHSNKVSKTINDTLQRVREVEEKGKGKNNSSSSKIEAAE